MAPIVSVPHNFAVLIALHVSIGHLVICTLDCCDFEATHFSAVMDSVTYNKHIQCMQCVAAIQCVAVWFQGVCDQFKWLGLWCGVIADTLPPPLACRSHVTRAGGCDCTRGCGPGCVCSSQSGPAASHSHDRDVGCPGVLAAWHASTPGRGGKRGAATPWGASSAAGRRAASNVMSIEHQRLTPEIHEVL